MGNKDVVKDTPVDAETPPGSTIASALIGDWPGFGPCSAKSVHWARGMHSSRCMQVHEIQTVDELQGIQAAWSHLPQNSPMSGPNWNSCWWDHYAARDEGDPTRPQLCLLSVSDREQLVGLAPWYIRTEALGYRVIRFLGSGEVCSDHQSVLAAAGYQDRVIQTLVQWLETAADQGRWNALHLSGVDVGDPMMVRLVRGVQNRGMIVQQRPALSCWSVQLPRAWDNYLESVTKNHRKRLRRWQRQYIDTDRAQLEVARSQDDLERMFPILERLHNQRRRALGEPGAFECSRFAAFHREVTRDLLSCGNLWLALVTLDGQPIAAEYQLRQKDRLFAYQSGIGTDSEAESPGSLSLLLNLRQAVEQGIGEVDFLRGDESYKARWGARAMPTIDVLVRCPWSRHRLHHAAWRTTEYARKCMKWLGACV